MAGFFLAQMVLGSLPLLHKFSKATMRLMVMLLNFILKLNVEDIKKYEAETELVWNSLEYLLYFYEPEVSKYRSKFGKKFEPIKQVYFLSVDVLLLSLHSTVGKSNNRIVIVSDNLQDYIVMLPWSVPSGSRDRAMCVVHEFTKNYLIQPPSLICIAKAALARSSVGLYSIIKTESISDLIHKIDLS